MILKAKQELFEGRGWDGLHDVIVDTLGVQPTKEQASNIFDQLPERVQEIAFKWGMDDTVFRDEAYEAIEELGITQKG